MLRQQCWDVIDSSMSVNAGSASSFSSEVFAHMRRRHIAFHARISTASDISFVPQGFNFKKYSSSKENDEDYRCKLNKFSNHHPGVLSFNHECLQSATSSMISDTKFAFEDCISSAKRNKRHSVVPLNYSTQQKQSLRAFLTSAYAFGKYLVLSSGAQQVSLLQGNGDLLQHNICDIFLNRALDGWATQWSACFLLSHLSL